jgi:hypothetical protein
MRTALSSRPVRYWGPLHCTVEQTDQWLAATKMVNSVLRCVTLVLPYILLSIHIIWHCYFVCLIIYWLCQWVNIKCKCRTMSCECHYEAGDLRCTTVWGK